MYAIISGNPLTGFSIIGPFPHAILACDWANAWEKDIDWWVAKVVDPADRETPNPKE